VTSVAVLGGGVGGLTAAHELAERGFDVTVYEALGEFGGKARSIPVPDSAQGQRKQLPGEHGFRFFPGFYRHLIDTMERIPSPPATAASHLVDASRVLLARAGDEQNELIVPVKAPANLNDLGVVLQFITDFGLRLGIRPWEIPIFGQRLLTLLTSCDERRYEQWEHQSWWEFSLADHLSENYRKFLSDGLTRTLVAARAREISARTGGLILCQLLFDIARVGGRADRVLDGPTSDVWITPWVTWLDSLGVTFRKGWTVTDIDCQGARIAGVNTQNDAGIVELVEADYYIAAIPVEDLVPLITPAMTDVDPGLARLDQLITRWMTGAMYYLKRDVPLQRGHAIFIDSEWALTAISQAQFWQDLDLDDYGDGTVDGILSVDISEWERPSKWTGKTAKQSTKEEILDEVWRQLTEHVNDGSLQSSNVVARFLDPAITAFGPSTSTAAENAEPLLINTAGSWHNRPEACTALENFFLASDFVRTYTDLATMEGANEAARRAVNGILDAEHSAASRCQLFALHEPGILAPLRRLDKLRWEVERPLRKLGVL
jgi:uncharacterized protein with NAD-binding domain and iron-sulfur cluster